MDIKLLHVYPASPSPLNICWTTCITALSKESVLSYSFWDTQGVLKGQSILECNFPPNKGPLEYAYMCFHSEYIWLSMQKPVRIQLLRMQYFG